MSVRRFYIRGLECIAHALGRSGLLARCQAYLDQQHIAFNKANSRSADVSFTPQSKVHNWTRDVDRIVVGAGSTIAGELLVFPAGGNIRMGVGCFLGENSRIWSMSDVSVGNNVLISHNASIMDTDSHELDADVRRTSGFRMLTVGLPPEKGLIPTAPIRIEDDCWVGIGAIVLKGVTIGQASIVAAGSVVTKDVPPKCVVAGNPARIVAQL